VFVRVREVLNSLHIINIASFELKKKQSMIDFRHCTTLFSSFVQNYFNLRISYYGVIVLIRCTSYSVTALTSTQDLKAGDLKSNDHKGQNNHRVHVALHMK